GAGRLRLIEPVLPAEAVRSLRFRDHATAGDDHPDTPESPRRLAVGPAPVGADGTEWASRPRADQVLPGLAVRAGRAVTESGDRRSPEPDVRDDVLVLVAAGRPAQSDRLASRGRPEEGDGTASAVVGGDRD